MARTAYHRFLQEYQTHCGGKAQEAMQLWRAASADAKEAYKNQRASVKDIVETRATTQATETPGSSGVRIDQEKIEKRGQHLYRVRKADCVGAQTQWVVGEGCFAYSAGKKPRVEAETKKAENATKSQSPLIYGVPVSEIEQSSGYRLRVHGKRLRELGRGIYGRVMLACSTVDDNCQFAMKLIPGENKIEIKLTRKAGSLGLGPKLFASGVVATGKKKVTYIVMEQFDDTLDALSTPLRGNAAQQLANLVDLALVNCLSHADLHKNNIMFRRRTGSAHERDNDRFEFRIIDFDPAFAEFGDCSNALARAKSAGSWLVHLANFWDSKRVLQGVLPRSAHRSPSAELTSMYQKAKKQYAEAYAAIEDLQLRKKLLPKPIK